MAKTALDLTMDEWQTYYPGAERYENAAAVKKRQRQAWCVARKAAQILREQFGARKVVVFGSLVHGKWFTSWSDIDLAAWGMPLEHFYIAVAAVTDLSSDFKVDLIDPEACRPTVREALSKEGVEL